MTSFAAIVLVDRIVTIIPVTILAHHTYDRPSVSNKSFNLPSNTIPAPISVCKYAATIVRGRSIRRLGQLPNKHGIPVAA